MSQIQFYLVDVETTGITNEHEMHELSIIRYKDRVQLSETIKCEHPENASYDALKICNKTIDDLDKGNTKEFVIEKVDKFLFEDGLTSAHRCFIAHNSNFDKRFMHAIYNKVGKKCPVDLWACTMAMTRFYAKKIGIVKPKVNLHAACDILEIRKIAEKHTSKSDVRNTYLLWKNLIEVRNIDYLPFIKNTPHSPIISESEDDSNLDPDLLDF